jgi:hypothetical protein
MKHRNQNIAITTIVTTYTFDDKNPEGSINVAASIHDGKVGEFLESALGDLIKISTTPSLCQTELQNVGKHYTYNITTTITYNVEP